MSPPPKGAKKGLSSRLSRKVGSGGGGGGGGAGFLIGAGAGAEAAGAGAADVGVPVAILEDVLVADDARAVGVTDGVPAFRPVVAVAAAVVAAGVEAAPTATEAAALAFGAATEAAGAAGVLADAADAGFETATAEAAGVGEDAPAIAGLLAGAAAGTAAAKGTAGPFPADAGPEAEGEAAVAVEAFSRDSSPMFRFSSAARSLASLACRALAISASALLP